jgi:hypothetical protein
LGLLFNPKTSNLMYRTVWENCKSSVCAIDFLSKAGTKITTFTGFKSKGYLVTDDVIDKFSKPEEVDLRFTEDGYSQLLSLRIPFEDFIARKVKRDGRPNPGFVLFDLDFKEFREIPGLRCSKKVDHRIGQPIAVLGYQLEQENLAIKSGIISSLIKTENGMNTIQVDCTIQQGNAGSPLIDAESHEVIGVIGHRLTSVVRSYRELMRIMNANLQVLKEAEGKINMEDIDPIQVLIVNQNQIKHMATAFYKSANILVGYASELCNMADYCPDQEDISNIDLEMNLDN